LSQFDEYLSKYPEDDLSGDIRFWLGEYYADKRDFARAELYFNDVIKIYPEGNLSDDAAYRLAIISYEKGELDKSMEALENLKDNYPKSDIIPTAELKIIEILMNKNAYSKAKQRLLKFTEDYKGTAFVKIASKYLGDIFRKEGILKDAINYYKESIDEHRGDFNAGLQLSIGQLYEELGDMDNAISEYLKVGYIYPDSAEIVSKAHLACAKLFEREKKWQEAEKLYRKIASMDTKEAVYAKERLKIIEENK